MATVQTESSRELQFFVEIIDSFKIAGDSTTNANYGRMKVTPFVDAMTMFLRIFDAFSNPFFSDVVKKDVQGNISVSKFIMIIIHNPCFVLFNQNFLTSKSNPFYQLLLKIETSSLRTKT